MNGSIMVRFPVGIATLAVPALARQRFFGAFSLIVMFVLTFADCFTRGM
jgi:hypothetical protein